MSLKVIFSTFTITTVFLIQNVLNRPCFNMSADLDLIMTTPNDEYSENNDINITEEIQYKIAAITDLDKDTKSKNDNNDDIWISYLRTGLLFYNPDENSMRVNWTNAPIKLKSKNNYKGRGMELSELIKYNGHLLSFDDRTGIVYEIDLTKNEPNEWITLMNGDGKSNRPFKSEWATVKDEKLYVGSTGNEWVDTKNEKILSRDPMFVKEIESNGDIEHINWQEKYDALRNAVGLLFPGYIWHEAGVWSDVHKEWFFLPRKCSDKLFDQETEYKLGCNLLLRADEDFKNISSTELNKLDPTHGYSSFKFVPNTNDTIILALASREVDNEGMKSYIVSFTIDGDIVMPEEKFSSTEKYEGIEFI